MTTPPTISDVLAKAADLIEPEGAWAQDSAGDSATCFCLASALGEAAQDSDLFWKARDFLDPLLPSASFPLIAFNDAPGRKQSEVVAKLREASSKAKERGL